MKVDIIKNAFAFILTVSSGIVSAAQGDVFTWTGAEDNYWTNKNNWAEGKIPNGMSKAIFDPGEGKTIYVNMKNRGWGNTSTWPNIYEFKSGNTYFSTYIRFSCFLRHCNTKLRFVALKPLQSQHCQVLKAARQTQRNNPCIS